MARQTFAEGQSIKWRTGAWKGATWNDGVVVTPDQVDRRVHSVVINHTRPKFGKDAKTLEVETVRRGVPNNRRCILSLEEWQPLEDARLARAAAYAAWVVQQAADRAEYLERAVRDIVYAATNAGEQQAIRQAEWLFDLRHDWQTRLAQLRKV